MFILHINNLKLLTALILLSHEFEVIIRLNPKNITKYFGHLIIIIFLLLRYKLPQIKTKWT